MPTVLFQPFLFILPHSFIYRFNWTDGKLNSSNLIELSGQITEKFDEEFRILYAQSLPLPVNARAPSSARNGSLYDHLVLKAPGTPPSYLARTTKSQAERLTSTPARLQTPEIQRMNKDIEEPDRKSNPVSDSSTLGEDLELALGSDDPPRLPSTTVDSQTQTEDVTIVSSCDVSTQTTCHTADMSIQTDKPQKSKPSTRSDHQEVDSCPPICPVPQDVNFRECFLKITKERQHHYSSIRSKLDHMVTLLSHKRELVDLTNLPLRPGLNRGRKAQQEARQQNTNIDSGIMGTWPKSRGLQ